MLKNNKEVVLKIMEKNKQDGREEINTEKMVLREYKIWESLKSCSKVVSIN